MFRIFAEGGLGWMSLLTIELIGVILAAWKAPGWVKEAGLLALITGTLGTLYGFYQMSEVIHAAGDISTAIIFGGVKVGLITVIYGCIIYAVSLIIRVVQKPRIL